MINGDINNFRENWTLPEKDHFHFCDDLPKSQTQLAFQQHWSLFSKLIGNNVGSKRSLEVGCGRGSLSAFFSQNGWDTTLLDSDQNIIKIAEENFKRCMLGGHFYHGNAENLEFTDNSFSLVFSIGLLEHFEMPEKCIAEKLRVLEPGGFIFNYVVPNKEVSVQKEFDWLQPIFAIDDEQFQNNKKELFRTDYDISFYEKLMSDLGVTNIKSSGVYSTPMLSPSSAFPFSLNEPELEQKVTSALVQYLKLREKDAPIHPWLCDEPFGHAILIWGQKGQD